MLRLACFGTKDDSSISAHLSCFCSSFIIYGSANTFSTRASLVSDQFSLDGVAKIESAIDGMRDEYKKLFDDLKPRYDNLMVVS